MNVLTRHAVEHPRLFMWVVAVFSVLTIGFVAAPTLAPDAFPALQALKVDTDPENMLADDELVRVFHNAMKAEFDLHDLIIVGIVQPGHPEGVFNPRTLANVHALAEFADGVRWTDDGETRGVIGIDIIAPSTVDSIEQAGLGAVSFSWLMPDPPETQEAALAVRTKAANIPMLRGTLVSGDGLAIALYVPITSKDVSYRVASRLREKIAEFDDGAEYHITGLPVAQDQFGVEMFVQMAISAPAAMLLIFVLMWLFFRRTSLIASPMIVAVVSVIGAMGALVATGHTVHIMSSMIPIFVMPIAVLDAVHILSDFYDRYPASRDRRETIARVMHELWQPMLFTTLTTCAGFASLAVAPVPPVQVFGLFVAVGVFLAWLLTVTLIPAYIMLLPERSFQGFGLATAGNAGATPLGRLLGAVGRSATARAGVVVSLLAAAIVIAIYGISRIEINDNPVKWFAPDHEIRVADAALNERFAGTYLAYLVLQPQEDGAEDAATVAARLRTALTRLGSEASLATLARLDTVSAPPGGSPADLIDTLAAWTGAEQDAASDEEWEDWEEVALAIASVQQQGEIFKRPDVLRFVERLQAHLVSTGLVGKSSAVTDIVKTVHRELLLGEEEEFRIPDTPAAVAQTLITFESSHRPQDLYKLVTPDFRKANLWVQLKSGDNKDMDAVAGAVAAFMAANPAPVALEHRWFGLTYINTVWQKRMVSGMLNAFLGSFAIVLMLMAVLFRSVAWAALSMAPLSVTIAVIYGAIGLTGRFYDMPIAVLSSLSLGLAVDYAIHFNARTREAFARVGNWPDTVTAVFGEPARAIFRNVVIIGTGFLPLVLAPLVPYQTVGVFISAILVLAGVSTLFALPAIITLFPRVFLKTKHAVLNERHAS